MARLGAEANLTASISLGDVDGDGDLDAVVANGRHWAQQNYVFLNGGDGFFRTARRLGEELATSYRAALGDFDGDGYPDVVVANSGSANDIYFNVPAEGSTRNWPGFRGPNASGLADGLDLPDAWDGESLTHIEWKTPIPGLGHSSPIFWADRVFLTTAVSDDPDSIFVHGLDGRIDRRTDLSRHSFRVYCLDRRSGAIVGA